MADPTQTPTPADPSKPSGPLNFNNWPPLLRHAASASLSIGLALLTTYLAGLLHVTPPPVQPIPSDQAADPTPPPMGWYSDADTLATARGMVPTIFRATPAGMDTDPLPANVYQWQVHERVTGQKTPLKDQGQTGDCVGEGSTTGYERALVCVIAGGGDFDFTYFSEEASYAVMRVDIGGGQLRGQDGGVGGWAGKAQTDIGMLPKAKYPDGDFSVYDAAKAKRLGDTGLTPALKAEMGKYRAGAVANLKTTTDLRKAMANGAGAYVCTARGYAAERDANGVCRRQGQWGHCMCCDGYATVNGKVQYHLDNSWDSMYHKGPVGPGDPSNAGFYIVESEMSAILAEGDSWAVSAVKGFPKQRKGLDWYVDARPAKPAVGFCILMTRRPGDIIIPDDYFQPALAS